MAAGAAVTACRRDSGVCSVTARPLTSRWYTALTLGTLAFTLYGSYVPFNYVPLAWSDATAAFDERVRATLWPTSKSDWVANWCLGVPLGFCLLGSLRVDRKSDVSAFVTGLAVLPACLAFSAAVEFGQLYFPGRACTGADIWAQVVGAGCGVLLWLLLGQRWTEAGRRSLGHLDGTGVLLIVYGGLAVLVQVLPLDVLTSPADWVRRLRDGSVTFVPLGELAAKPGVTAVQDWKKVAAWCELLALAIPGGVLLAGLAGRWRSVNALPTVAAVALSTGLLLELAQWPIQSRRPSSTDALVIAVGVIIGWGTALAVSDRGSRGYRPSAAVVFGQLWFAVLAVHHWQPFEFRPQLLGTNAGRIHWLPFEHQIGKAYLWGLEELLMKAWLFLPMGVVAAWGWKRSTGGRALTYASLVCVGAATVLAFGQLITPNRTTSPTDLLLALGGGWVGAYVTRQRMVLGSPKPFVPRSRPVNPNWWHRPAVAGDAMAVPPTTVSVSVTVSPPTSRAPL